MGKIADNPYPGSRAFQPADQARFFGRGADTAAIVNLWMTNRLTIVSGPVASGKTSLLQAGVYPLMPAKQSSILPPGDLFQGMTFPFAALPEHNPFTLGLLRSWSPDDVPTRLAGLSITDFLRRRMPGGESPTYAAIDHLDDLILDNRDGIRAKWREQFLAEMTKAYADHPRLHLLLVIRTEAVDLLTAAVGSGARHAIAGLTPDDAVAAIAQPARGAGRSFTDEAAARLVEDLRTTRITRSREERPLFASHVEPSLLQAVCRQLWEDLPPSVTDVTEWEAREFCDVDSSLAAYCGVAISQVATDYDTTPRRLRSWLLDNFVTDNRTRGGVYEGARTTAGEPNAVPRSLLDLHLLTCGVDESVRHYRLLSSRLIEPLRIAEVDRLGPAVTGHPGAGGFLGAAERDLARAELDFAWQHAERALGATASLHERAKAQMLLANVAHEQGKSAEALVHYREAADLLQAVGDTHGAAYQLAAVGQVTLSEGRTTSALLELRAAVERAPNDLALQTQLALALWQRGEGQAAVGILNWALTIDGGYAEARRARGEILADLGDGKAALADLDRAASDRPSIRAARGLALAELGDFAPAANGVNEAVTDAPRNGAVLLYAARAFDLAGDKDSARERAREALDATDPPLSRSHRQLASKLAGYRSGLTNPSSRGPDTRGS